MDDTAAATHMVPLCDADFNLILDALNFYAKNAPEADLQACDSLLTDLEMGGLLWVEVDD